MQPKNFTVNITNRTILRTILWVVAAILAFKFIGRVSHILVLIFAAIFLSLALNPVVSGISNHLKVRSRVRATAAAYLLVVIILAAFFTLVIPPLVKQTRDFIKDVPQLVENFQNQDSGLSRAAKHYHVDEKLTKAAKDFTSHYGNFGSTLLDTGKRIASVVASILAVLVMTFMMLVEGPRWLELIIGLFSEKNQAHHKKIAQRMYKAVTGFVNGQVILAVVAGLFAFIALEVASHIVGTSINALALAGIVSVFGIIPLFGNPISSTVVILFSLFSSVTLAIVMIVYFIVYYFIENHTFQPILQSKLNDLTPLTVFVAAILGVGVGGILGAIVAIPIASAVKILLEDYFERQEGHKPTIENLKV